MSTNMSSHHVVTASDWKACYNSSDNVLVVSCTVSSADSSPSIRGGGLVVNDAEGSTVASYYNSFSTSSEAVYPAFNLPLGKLSIGDAVFWSRTRRMWWPTLLPRRRNDNCKLLKPKRIRASGQQTPCSKGWSTVPLRKFQIVILIISLSLCCSGVSLAQTTSKAGSASIAGRVTLGGKGIADIVVVASIASSYENRTVAQTRTDVDGKYRLSGLPMGAFRISPVSKAHAVGEGPPTRNRMSQSINVADGESVSDIDFQLLKGGVITGRISDPDGTPVINEQVAVSRTDAQERAVWVFNGPRNRTDDRGVYRIYGLAPGDYTVSVGQDAPNALTSAIYRFGSQYLKTYYPGTTKVSDARTIGVKEGAEISNVDFVVGNPPSGFAISGRVVDAAGQPIQNIVVGYANLEKDHQGLGQMNIIMPPTDSGGKFRAEGIQPGSYGAYTMGGQAQPPTLYSELSKFEVSDADVTGIEIKLRRGATIRGVAVIENNADPALSASLQAIHLYASSEKEEFSAPSVSTAQVLSDGTFTFSGLAPGKIRVTVQQFPQPPVVFSLLRMEVNGVAQESIDVIDGDEITGVRLIFSHGAGSIRGRVTVEGGSLPQGTTFWISLTPPAGGAQLARPYIEVDVRGRFFAENIPPGTYELKTHAMTTRQPARPILPVTRSVTVANGVESEITVVLNLTTPEKN